MAKSAREIFGKPAPRVSSRALYAHFRKKEGPRELRITTRSCKKCGETMTSCTRYFCAGCHFGNTEPGDRQGWWSRWV